MSRSHAFLWISGWSVPAAIWQPYEKKWPNAKHFTLSFEHCRYVHQIYQQASTTFQQIHAGPVTLVGWSLGSIVAIQLAHQFPKRVHALFLISGAAAKGKTEKIGWNQQVLKQMKKKIQVDPARVIELFDRKMFSAIEQQADYYKQWREQWRQELPPSLGLQTGLDFLQQYSLDDLSFNVEVPVFLLAGEKDEICPPMGTQLLARQFSRSTYTVWPECGHACFWTQRQRFEQWMMERFNDVNQ